MLTLFISDSCPSCSYTESLLKLYFNKDEYKVDSVKNLTIKYSKVPVIQVDSEYVKDYNDFEDFIEQLSKLTNKKINLDDIYDKLVKIIYSATEDDNDLNNEQIIDLFEIMKIKDVSFHHNKGYQLAHHIISSCNDNLIKKFIRTFFDKLNSYQTSTHILNNTSFKIYIPSGQNLKHIAAQNNQEVYSKLNIISESPDECGFYPSDYFKNRNNLEFVRQVNKIISEKHEISFDINNLIVDVFENSDLKKNIINEILSQNRIQPNSMHKTGVILDKNSKNLKEFIKEVNSKFDLKLDEKSYSIYAFTAEYSNCTNNYLDKHKDSSIITINWNLEVSIDIEGTELLIPSMDKIIKAKKDQLIIHHGMLEHQVNPRVLGSRLNLIVWLK